MTWFHAARARLRLLAPRAAESRIDDEIRFHIDMETQRLVREQTLDHDEARRRALATFGGVQQHRQTLREGRGTAWFSGFSLDLKLGFRMLVKHPGLALVGGLAMAFGIWFGAVTFQMFGLMTSTELPLPDGDRIVKIQNWDAKVSEQEDRVLYDYQFWRSARSITDLGAWRDATVNLVGADSSALPAAAAEVTASAFRIAPERPLLGRVLQESDERAGAVPVVVLGYDVWTRRFNSDPGVVGRSVQLGNHFATVVGVMPDGYAFPVSHEMWLPLRTDASGVEPRRGPVIKVFGRLASGMTLKNAQVELASLGSQLAAAHPATHAQVQPRVTPYTQMGLQTGDQMKVMALSYLFVVALVIVVCSTVALLLFARAASRETEILVRSALGASRRRIVTQLFAEALVLAGVAAVIGLATAQLALTRLGRPYLEMNIGRLPFWYDFNLSPTAILYALGLAVIGAVVAGVMPARKITRGLGNRLRAGTAGGGGVSFGGIWTGVIVVQVALTVMFPAVVLLVRSESIRIATFDVGFPEKEYLGVTLGIDGPPEETLTPATSAALGAQFSASLDELRRRLEAEPGVSGVTFVDAVPRDYHAERKLEVEALPKDSTLWAGTASIHPSYFDVLQVPMIAGRPFNNADLSPDARVVIVDRGFADLVMPGRNVIGHRIRMRSWQMTDSAAALEPWYEIVGVVKELGMAHAVERQRTAGVYLPTVPGTRRSLSMLVHARGEPLTLAPRVREVATAVDPALHVDPPVRLDQAVTPLVWFLNLWMRIIMGLTAVTLVLSLAGIYAVLSYIVARRTREIGVRAALGASARQTITSLFRRPMTQVTSGVVAGSLIIAAGAFAIQYTTAFQATDPRGLTLGEVALLVAYAILMLGICALACVVPTIRALRVQPMEALRTE